jgi:crotonobetainyl-CoA:carnitine CoA-transferase CaiB-like acyl-CoA transferase
MTSPAGSAALDGIRVLDLTIIVQGPQATAMLHDLGADVVKIELPEIGDMARFIGRTGDEPRSPYFEGSNRGKRSATLDVRTPGGLRAMHALIAGADVLVSNFRPGTLDEWGLSYEQCREINPGIIYATGSALGPVGPDAQREGADLSGQAAGGMISTTGRDGGEPTPVGATVADATASLTLACGVLAALFHRQRSGEGQRVDVSLLGGQIWAQASEYTSFLLSGRQPGRSNGGHPLLPALYGIFPTSDGWIAMVGCPPPLWPGFCRAVERPDLADDPRFCGLLLAPEHVPALFEVVSEVFTTRTTAEWCERLAVEQQRFAPVRSYAEVVADPQAHENGYFVRLPHPDGGEVTVVGNPIRLSATPARPGATSPALGQHTEEVLLEAGLSWDDIIALRDDGAY